VDNDILLKPFSYILNYYYGNIDTPIIKRLNPNDTLDLDSIAIIADEFNLEVQQAMMKIDEIDSALLPCLAIYENKAVVISNITKEGFSVYDGAEDKTKEIERGFFVGKEASVLFFQKSLKQEQIIKSSHRSKEWFWGYFKDEWQAFLEIGVLTFFINFFVLAVPLFVMNVYDRVIPNFALETLAVLAVGVVIILVFDLILKSARVYIIESVGKKISSSLEEDLMHKTMTLKSSNDEFLAGSKANLFKELYQVSDFFASKTVVHMLDLPFFIVVIIVILIISVPSASVVILGAFLIFGVNFFMHYPLANISKKIYEKGQTKQNYIFENLKGVETIKLSNALNNRLYKWKNILRFFSTNSKEMQLYNNLATNLSYFILQVVTIGVIIVGVYEIEAQNMSVGALIAITIFSSRALAPVVHLSSIILKIKEFRSILDSIDSYYALPSESEQGSSMGAGRLEGGIEFDRVSFTYKESKIANINNCSFKIAPKERVGIIGKTGAGKSTIARLITGLDEPSKGNIFFDGHNISTLHPFELRENIGIMTQEPYLFAGTLAENIELDKPIGKDNLIKLIKDTGLEELLKRSDKGEALYVGEGGNRLSVGQRHLVALARALIKNPPILILDEPTTGMDVGLERDVIEHLKQTAKDKTLIVITHRFAALDLVDRVMVLNDGFIVADGEKNKILTMLKEKR